MDSSLASVQPAVLAGSPVDGRFHLQPDEVDPHTRQAGRLVFNADAVDAVVAGRKSRILAPTLTEEVMTLEFETVKTRSANTHTIQGHVVGEKESSTAQIVYHDGILQGNVMRYDKGQEIEYRIMSDGHMMVREVDIVSQNQVACGTCAGFDHSQMLDHFPSGIEADIEADVYDAIEAKSFSHDEDQEAVNRDTSGWRTVDVTVGYDPDARTNYSSFSYNGYSGIEARIIAAVDRMNQAFINSEITDTEMILLGTIEDPDYDAPGSSSNLGDELTNLRNEDGVLDAVTDFNNRLGGDLVTFVVGSGQGQSGVANSANRYAIVSAVSMTASGLVYAHELGHNMNAQHAWADTGLNEDSNTGWRFYGQGGGQYRTIMAYGESAWLRIPYYSNPNVLFDGSRTGAEDGYDATNDTTVDSRLVVGGYDIAGKFDDTITGFDGSVLTRGADNARVIDTGDGKANAGATAASFWATRSDFEIINPLAGTEWEKGTTQTIQFNGGDYQDIATISLYKGGVLQSTFATDVNPIEARNIEWTIPYDLPNGTDYMIRVELDRNGGMEIAESGNFRIYSSLPRVSSGAAPAVPEGIGVISSVELTFNVPMDLGTFDAGTDIISFLGPVGNSVLASITGTSWSEGNTVLTIEFTPPAQHGAYELVIGPDIEDAFGTLMDQDGDGTAGESVEDRHTYTFTINPPLPYYASMDRDPGWTFIDNRTDGKGWAYGQPTGQVQNAYRGKDPSSGFNGPNVIGYNLNGSYEIEMPLTRWAVTPVIDCSNHENTRVKFQRWLGVYWGFDDTALLQVSNDGVNWTTLWENPETYITDDGEWIEEEYDISAVADGQSTVYVRWGIGPTDWNNNGGACGWNIDEVVVFGDIPGESDNTAPYPSPMAFANAPAASSIDSITMTATAALDVHEVEYYFTETSGNPGGSDSGWQDSPTYTDTGLDEDTQYTYTVTARDKSPNQNVTDPSAEASATTDISYPPEVDAGSEQSATIGGFGTPWTPEKIQTDAWYDASDSFSMTVIDDGVFQWLDKSGNDRHALQSTAARQPALLQAALNDKDVVSFDGSDDYFELGTHLDFLAGVSHSAFIVVADITSFQPIYGSQKSRGGANSLEVGFDGSKYKVNIFGDDFRPLIGHNFDNSGSIVNFIWPIGSPREVFANGNLEAVDDVPAPAIDTLRDGGHFGFVMDRGYFGGDIAEMVFLTGTVTSTDRERMEGYLAHKWGLTDNLPANHPYKTELPQDIGAEVQLNGTVTDSNGDSPDTEWTVVSGPAPVRFADPTIIDTTATFSEEGTYVLRLTADDGIYVRSSDVTITVNPGGNDFTNWISGYDVGDLTAAGDDYDGDGIPNAIENYFGTDPSAPSVGLYNMEVSTDGGSTFTFKHPMSENPASDITASYRWSTDLSQFHGSGESNGAGTTVTFEASSPVNGEVTVTATVSDTSTEKLFVSVFVVQE
ncbi:M12 family metallo-peptidase [Coraliomargarita sinensis]|uniref:M12 family metallo-peptidase n=1 Tax=Coraliomargarita sinensis TaxID=2174842 RepID=UPI001304F9D7|nr:M12 family metallo-peptidase [Coraliomargarita sinensis]